MTSFRFRLQRVLDLRRTQLQIAENNYRIAQANLQSLRAVQVALDRRKTETRQGYSRLPNAMGYDFEPLPNWYRWIQCESARLLALEKELEQEVEKRRLTLIEAQKKVRLLERLRDQRHNQWQSAFDKELETLAADATASRYVREASHRPKSDG